VQHFGASVDTPDNLKRFAEQLGFDYPLLSDPTRQVARKYGVVSDDTSFASRWTFYIGVDGRILHVDRQVSPTNAGRTIVDRLAQLGVARRGRR
jgi:peroxiredoxin Q/BCP